jgi:hypothetical protein
LISFDFDALFDGRFVTHSSHHSLIIFLSSFTNEYIIRLLVSVYLN